MWEWIYNELFKQMKTFKGLNGRQIDKDDVIGNVSLYLCQHKEEACKIYKEKKKSILYQMLKHEIYAISGMRVFKDKMEYSRFQRIKKICQEYNIEIKKENAYKIFALLDNSENFTINGIEHIIEMAEPLKYGYKSHELSLEAMFEYK